MTNEIIIPKDKQNKWEQIFEEMLDIIDFQLVRYGRGYYGLSDKQGANLNNIEKDLFQNAEQIIDRMDVYIEDYFVAEIEGELSLEHISCPTDEEILNGDEPFSVMDCEWYWRVFKLLPHSDPQHGPRFIAEHQFDYDVLDLILHHYEEVNLENISAIETNRKMHVVAIQETYRTHFHVLAASDEEATSIVDEQWNCGALGKMSGEDYLNDSYQVEDVTQKFEDFPLKFEVVEDPDKR